MRDKGEGSRVREEKRRKEEVGRREGAREMRRKTGERG